MLRSFYQLRRHRERTLHTVEVDPPGLAFGQAQVRNQDLRLENT
jgi:hypothetical protein